MFNHLRCDVTSIELFEFDPPSELSKYKDEQPYHIITCDYVENCSKLVEFINTSTTTSDQIT